MKSPLLALIRLYKATLSPYWPTHCGYTPSCSGYAYESVERFGALRGGWMALKRLGRCQPWGKYGYDPVPLREGQSTEVKQVRA